MMTNGRWPETEAVDASLFKAFKYLGKMAHVFRLRINSAKSKSSKKGGKGKGGKGGGGGDEPAAPPTISSVTVYVASEYPPWQRTVLSTLDELWDNATVSRVLHSLPRILAHAIHCAVWATSTNTSVLMFMSPYQHTFFSTTPLTTRAVNHTRSDFSADLHSHQSLGVRSNPRVDSIILRLAFVGSFACVRVCVHRRARSRRTAWRWTRSRELKI
jgi:hypothetical protein